MSLAKWKEAWTALDAKSKAALVGGVGLVLFGLGSKKKRLPPAKATPAELTGTPAVALCSSADGEILRGQTVPGTVASAVPETIPWNLERLSRNQSRALAWEDDDTAATVTWKYATWAEYVAEVRQAARAMIELGLKPRESVCILGFNSKEWVIADLACILAGGFASGIYATNGPEATKYILEHSKCAICVVEDGKQRAKVMSVAKGLPHLKALVSYREASPPSAGLPAYSWANFLELGNKKEAELEGRISAMKPGHCATLIYTSGTTGNPKAVMVSHDSVTWVVRSFAGMMRFGSAPGGKERIVSYLPLSHIAAQSMDIFAALVTMDRSLQGERDVNGNTSTMPVAQEVCLYFARADALKGSLKMTLCAARPTVFFGVPRVWEKFAEALQAVGAKTVGLKKKISTWAKKTAKLKYDRNRADFNGTTGGLLGILMSAVTEKVALTVLKKVHAAIGLDAAYFCMTGAAPIAVSTLEYFGSLGLVVNEAFGMSEVSGPAAVTLNHYYVPGTCGPALPGMDIRLEHVAGRDRAGEGEICFRGRSVMMGYLYDDLKSKATIDGEGWCHSGDIGTLLPFGGAAPMLRITGRVKELIITAGGENVAPVPIEDQLKTLLPGISTAVLIGDKLKFLSVLFTLKQQTNETTGSFDDVLIGAAAQVNPTVKTALEAAKDAKWTATCQTAIDTYNTKHAVSAAQKIQKFAILERDFSQVTGELTPTLKLKRAVLLEKYAHVLNKLYGSENMKSAVWS